jgi:hypothetical protein
MQEEKGLGTSNSGCVNRGGGLVVDTFWDLPHTRDMIAHYARVWRSRAARRQHAPQRRPRWGNQLFPTAELIGIARCAEGFGRERPEMMQMLRSQAGSENPVLRALAAKLADWDFTGVTLTPPTTLIDDRLELDLDGIRVELLWVGPAHTAGDVIAWLPTERIVFTGDVPLPAVHADRLGRHVRRLDRRPRQDRRARSEGRRCPGTARSAASRDRARCASTSPTSAPSAASSSPPACPRSRPRRRSTSARTPPGPEPERIVFQVERAYRELQGVAYDTPLDVNVLFAGMYEVRQAMDARAQH